MVKPTPVPALQSNYIWVLPAPQLADPDKTEPAFPQAAYVIDPGDAGPILTHFNDQHLTLAGILVTHHHWDHTDGLDSLLEHRSVPVYGPDSVPQVTHPLREGDRLTLQGWEFEVLAVPGHTLDHLAYITPPGPGTTPRRLFCGDALFAAGCGRLFEGAPAMALNSLQKLNQLPGDTEIYCAHEYTVTNLRFALEVEPDNKALIERLAKEQHQREQGLPTLPSQLDLERQTNPFLRTHLPSLQQALLGTGSATVENPELSAFTELRQRKDRFR